MWTVNFLIILLTFWTTLYFFMTRKFNYWKNKKVPYVPPIPFFGNAFRVFTMRQNIGDLTQEIYKKVAAPCVGFFICDHPYLLIRDPELIRAILVKDFHIFSDRNVANNKKDDPMGTHMLFLLKNPDWRDMRRKVSPVFTSAKIKAMYKLVQNEGLALIDYLKREVERRPVVDVKETLMKYTTNVITSTAFGINANCFKDDDAEFRKVSRRIFNWSILERAISTSCYFIAPTLVKLFRLKFVDSTSTNFLREVFWKTIFERERTKVVRNDLLDILIDIKNQEDINDPYKLEGDKLVAQATQFFVAGYETTGTTMVFTLYELAIHKDIQKKLRQEIIEEKSKNGEITYDSLKQMDYLDMCIKEAMRKYPILPFLDRKCSANYQLPESNVVIDEGISVFVSILGLHYDSKYYPDPEKYDPTRFTEENVQSRPPFTYLPFGEGPRNCIGSRFAYVNMKSTLALLLLTFEIDLCDETQHPVQIDPKGFLVAPVSDLFLKFTRIDTEN